MTAPAPALPPPPPRFVRWRSCLVHRWLLGLLGGLALLDGVILAVVLGVVAGGVLPFDDLRLDEATGRADGIVTSVETTSPDLGRETLHRVHFRFRRPGGGDQAGTCYASGSAPDPGALVTIEFLADDPATCRIQGTTRAGLGRLGSLLIGLVALPGFVLLAVWWRGVLRLRALLRSGRATLATVSSPGAGAGSAGRVELEFTDGRGAPHRVGQWVRAASPLGRALAAGAREVVVVHDEVEPARARAVTPQDFLA
jgi:hypothetical protein